ncbi:MAG TPA: alpha/beta hydrolase-fold protein [Chitinophagaceae bacterium]|nr:alpha/beta hydrolase-fold protein [Chitinophagaceae bacterium]
MKSISLFVFSSLFTLLLFGQDTAALKESKPFILGSIHEIESKVLAEKRVLNIYLPTGYNEKDTIKYPVIYLLDGSADEDFIHIAGLIQFSNFPWVNLLPNSILVGIANVDRRRDFTFPTTIEKDKKDFPTTGQSGKFINFIESELQPFISKTYKTTTDKTIIGQSLGGLLATEILFKKPQLFTNYIIVSPSLWWDNESLLAVSPKVLKPDTHSVFVFIAAGKEGKIMEADTKKLVSMLKDRKKNLRVNFEYLTDENHASILHNAVYKGFQAMNKSTKKKV